MPHIPDSRHAGHDPLAIAAYAAGDAAGTVLDDALAMVAVCPDCAALHADLRAIAAAMAALPAAARPRDFRLTAAQAAALRPSGWRRVLAPFAGPRFAFAGPLGSGLATLGIAGLLVAGSVGAPIAATAPGPAAGEPERMMSGPQAAPGEGRDPGAAPAIEAVPEAQPELLPVPAPSGDGRMGYAQASVQPDDPPADDLAVLSAASPAEPPATGPLAWAAGILALVGVGLAGVRLAARRAR